MRTQLDGGKMRPSPTDLRLLALGLDGKRSGVAPTLASDGEGCIRRLEAAIGRGAAQEIVDFDTHLDDPSSDWMGNAALMA